MKPYRDIGNFKTRGIAHKNTWYHLQKTRGIAHYVRGIAHLITWYRTLKHVVWHTFYYVVSHIRTTRKPNTVLSLQIRNPRARINVLSLLT